MVNDNINNEPITYQDAITSIDKNEWQQAMQQEMNSLIKCNTWTLCELPPGRNAIGNRWVYKTKLNEDGSIERYKARLVVQGFSQQQGIDYTETFAPVVKYKSLRIILAISTIMDYELKQMDVETAFLNAQINEDVYMKQPQGFGSGGVNANLVCKLNKALYGTKQAPHEWNNTLNQFIVNELQFKRCIKDSCVYIKSTSNNHLIILSIFVDDILIAYHKQDELEWFDVKQQFMNKFQMKDLDNVKFILGMHIKRDRVGKQLSISHELYIKNLLKKFNMQNAKSISTPSELTKLTESTNNQLLPDYPYPSLVGSLMYTSTSVRPDITYATHSVSRFMSKYSKEHINAAKRILRYLIDKTAYGLIYKSNINDSSTTSINDLQLNIEAYSDADLATAPNKSTSGYVIMINDCVVSWAAKKQTIIATSTAYAEIIANYDTICELNWITDFISELNINYVKPVVLYCDNQAAVEFSKHDTNHSRSKHIAIKYYYVKEQVDQGVVTLRWISTKDQIADIFTKALTKNQHQLLSSKLIQSTSNTSIIFSHGGVL
jgi:hypothetical protein